MALGSPSYSVYVQRRGGKPVAELPWSSISWGRALDDCSSASVEVPITSSQHALAWIVGDLEAWEYELSIWRAITSKRFEPVWIGPITEPSWDADKGVTIQARDLTEWYERRILTTDRTFVNADLATIFSRIAADAMNGDTTPGVVVTPTPTGVRGDRKILASEKRVAADVLRELARDGLDYTAIARTVLTGGIQVPAGRLPPMTDGVLRKPVANGLGLLTASKAHILGSSGAGTPIVATAGGVSLKRGLVERVFHESDIADARSASRAASTRWDALHAMPLSLSGSIDARRGPQIDQLIPGALARAQLNVGARYIDRDVRLSQLQVRVDVSGGAMQETVTAQFEPVGTVEGPSPISIPPSPPSPPTPEEGIVGAKALWGSATWNPGSLASDQITSVDVACAGALVGDPAFAAFNQIAAALGSGAAEWMVYATVLVNDQVHVDLWNRSGLTVDLPAGTVKVTVLQQT